VRTKITFVAGLAMFMWLLLAPWPVQAGGRIPLILYRGGTQGRVVFDHQTHASKGLRCNDCHTDFARTGKALFFTRKQALITFEDHQTATKCFGCHNGKGEVEGTKSTPYDGRGAFNECERCHRNAEGS
jgi:phosphate transport system substrate-binding protein